MYRYYLETDPSKQSGTAAEVVLEAEATLFIMGRNISVPAEKLLNGSKFPINGNEVNF